MGDYYRSVLVVCLIWVEKRDSSSRELPSFHSPNLGHLVTHTFESLSV